MNERMNVTVGETVEEGEGGIFWHEVEGGNVGDVDGFESHFLVREREGERIWLVRLMMMEPEGRRERFWGIYI